MRPILYETITSQTPVSLAGQLHGEPGLVLLRSSSFDSPQARYSFVAARPFLTFRSFGSSCEIFPAGAGHSGQNLHLQFGNPWQILDALLSRFELLDEIDLPFPLGGCFGYWGYDLKNFVEPKLQRRAINDLELPDCQVGFYDSLVVFDHQLGKIWIVSTGLRPDGSRSEEQAVEQLEFWQSRLDVESRTITPALSLSERERENRRQVLRLPMRDDSSRNVENSTDRTNILPRLRRGGEGRGEGILTSNLTRAEFLSAVERSQRYIRAGDIYQVNLSHRLTAHCDCSGWELFKKLTAVSPAPFSAYITCGNFQIVSSSPEQFLRMSGSHIVTRPIKGTRPRDTDQTRDAQLAYELQTSAKELAELVMITDLLRNDLGKVCEYGSVLTPDLARLERFAQVQHLVSTVEGRLRNDVTQFAAFASCFPGGSVTGAPKIRAAEIIDELEPNSRGPYCGAIGYIGFNRESQLSITIRTAICNDGLAHCNVGAGIVADSNPEAEYVETLAKAAGFLSAINQVRMDTNPRESSVPRSGA